MSSPEHFAVVSAEEAQQIPYPYIYVNADGTARELHQAERDYLEEAFSPMDGARPYVKGNFNARDGSDSIKGYCHRSEVPSNIPIADAPANDPNPPLSKEEYIAWLKSQSDGFDVVEKSDGTVVMTRIKPAKSPLRRFANFFLQWIGHEI
jgi:hypothetical protein